MKKILFISVFVSGATLMNAQEAVTVSIEGNKVAWYSLENGEKGNNDAAGWDIAFDLKAQDAAIRTNDAYGVSLYEFPGGFAEWDNITEQNTTGLTPLYNSDTIWRTGAFNQIKDPFFPQPLFDYGWGTYDSGTHNVIGYRVFIIERTGVYKKKIKIDEMESSGGGRYRFTIADIDGSNELNLVLEKSDYGNQQFAYYNIETNTFPAHEVAPKDEWDLYFTKYQTIVTHPTYGSMMYPAPAGILTNENVQSVKVEGVNVATYNDYWGKNFSPNINIIGWEWCGYNFGVGGTHTFNPAPDEMYFVKAVNGDVWKLVFTGYQIAGIYDFTKELISTSSLNENEINQSEVIVYPNPASNNVSLILNNMKGEETQIDIVNVAGQSVYQNVVSGNSNFEVENINTSHLEAGIYIVKVQSGSQTINQKLILR
ncbi:MAG: T9SS type A sorting domain-containing protein [Brumimicrobium sp.]